MISEFSVPHRTAGALLRATLLGSAAILPFHAQFAAAQDVTISDDRTSTQRSSTLAPNGQKIVIDAAGSIVVDSGVALVIDSPSLFENNGLVASDDRAGGGVGIDVLVGTGLAGGIVNNASIRLDGKFSTGDDFIAGQNFGIRLGGTGTFTGDIENGSTASIRVVGVGSVGLELGTFVDGNVTNAGGITMIGEDSVAVAIRRGLSGSFENRGSIAGVSFGGERGVLVEGDIGGAFRNLGSITTGKNQTFDNRGRTLPQISGGPAVFISASIAGGFLNGPVAIPDTPDADGDGIVDVVPGAGASINGRGEGRAVHITTVATDGSMRDVTLGRFGTAEDDVFGFINRAGITATSQERGFDVEAIRIEGSSANGSIFTTRVEGGLLNDTTAAISVLAIDGDSSGIHIGNHVDLGQIRNAGNITVSSIRSEDDQNADGVADSFGPGGDATAIFIDELAIATRFENSGTISVTAQGTDKSAFAFVDRSGGVTDFINSGTINTVIQSDGTGSRIAADLSRATGDITFTNTGTIIGDVLLGSGNDTLSMNGGILGGTLDFGAGVGTFTLTGESTFSGALFGETIDLSVSNSTFATTTRDSVRVRNASFSDNATLILSVVGDETNAGALIASDTVSIGAGTTIDPEFFAFPASGAPIVLISAGTLILGDSIDNLNLQIGLSSVIFEQSLAFVDGVEQQLVVNLRQRSAGEIGLGERRGTFFDAVVPALPADDALGAAIANIASLADLENAIDQMLPESSELPRHVAINNQGMMLGILAQRFSTMRNMDEAEFPNSPRSARAALGNMSKAERRGFNMWIQEVGYVGNRESAGEITGFDGETVGFAVGADYPLFGLDAIGISAMQTVGEYNDDLADRDDFEVLATQLSVYASKSFGGFFIDAIGSYAILDFERDRTISIGNLTRGVSADWDATQWGAGAQAGYRARFGRYGLTASGSVSYTKLDEDGYGEVTTNGLGFTVEDRKTTSFRAGGSLAIDGTWSFSRGDLLFKPILRVGYITELSDDVILTRARFGTDGGPFDIATPVAQDDMLLGGIGFSFITDSVDVTFNYEQERASEFQSHVGSLTVRIRF